jgi:hypothetical protein
MWFIARLLSAMNRPVLLSSTLALSALLSGCVGTGPNTQQGAVTGGTLGAIAGAIIGHNSRGGDALGGAILGATAGAIVGGTIGNSVDNERGTLYRYPSERRYRVARVQRPPPALAETIPTPPPAANAIWAPGYWLYDGRGYSWSPGHWEIPPPYAHAYVLPISFLSYKPPIWRRRRFWQLAEVWSYFAAQLPRCSRICDESGRMR